MADPKSPKTAIEQALVAEAVDTPDYGRSFGRTFNRDGGTFSRIFSRGGAQLKDLSVQDVVAMDDAAFKKFADRLRLLQENPLAGPSESSKGH